MTDFAPQDIRKLARLARIHVSDADTQTLAKDMNGIFAMIAQLQTVNTDGVEPLHSISATTLPLRDDQVTDGAIAETITANAPEADHGFFVVPKVVGGEG